MNVHSTEDHAVLICLVVANNVIVVEDAYLEYCVVSTDAQIRDRQDTDKLQRQTIAIYFYNSNTRSMQVDNFTATH